MGADGRSGRAWRIDDGRQTLALASEGGRLPEVVYWGPPLPEGEDLAAVAAAARHDLTGGMLDALPPLSICPEAASGFMGQPGLVLASEDGSPLAPRFGGLEVSGDHSGLRFAARDDALGLTYGAEIETTPSGLLALRAWLKAEVRVRLRWLAAPVLPGPELADEIVEVSGRWLGEFRLVRTPWASGARLREARGGRSGHEHVPFAILPGRGATDAAGEAHALHYAWSGGHRMVAEELPDGRRQVQFGHAAGSEREPGTRFETATLLATWSGEGLNGAAVRFQRHLRDHRIPWPDRARPRPVHCNTWEAVYFRHDLATLTEIAEAAARLGAERFVLDDGWFGGHGKGRDDDTSSLGDWTVDRRKWPDGLHPLIERVHALGMTFGLWVEPEMVSPDSDLHRAHPDWALGPPDQVTGRGQLVLDLARAEVREHLLEALSALLDEYPIEYLKWDHNRLLPVADAAQARGVHALIDHLRAAHPGVEIESCASGGGRIDAGILGRTHRVWLSDSNDALERLRIQHDAALLLPAAATGSHVGPARSHTSGRVLPMSFRAWVAAQRHMGFELDPRGLSDEEARTLARVTAWWKANRGWLMGADILRLDAADPAVLAEVHVSSDRARFVSSPARPRRRSRSCPAPCASRASTRTPSTRCGSPTPRTPRPRAAAPWRCATAPWRSAAVT